MFCWASWVVICSSWAGGMFRVLASVVKLCHFSSLRVSSRSSSFVTVFVRLIMVVGGVCFMVWEPLGWLFRLVFWSVSLVLCGGMRTRL